MDGSTRAESTEIYFNDQYYYASLSNKNIDIYSTRFVNLVQVPVAHQILDVSHHDVVAVRSSFVKPALFVLTRKAVLVYSPYYSIYGTINLRLIHEDQLSAEFSSMEVSASGDYLVLTNRGTGGSPRRLPRHAGCVDVVAVGRPASHRQHQLGVEDKVRRRHPAVEPVER